MRWRCLLLRKKLALAAGDDLPEREKTSVEGHVESCPACRERLAALRSARDVLIGCDSDPLQDLLPLWPALRSRLKYAEEPGRVTRYWLPAGALAAASVAIAVMLWDRPARHDGPGHALPSTGLQRVVDRAEPGPERMGPRFEMADAPGPWDEDPVPFNFHLEKARPVSDSIGDF